MLITQTVEKNGKQFTYNFSDAGKMIKKVGTEELYKEAYDPVEFSEDRTYVETELDIDAMDDADEAEEADESPVEDISNDSKDN